MNKIYLIKNITTWMLDELMAFSEKTKFKVVLLRKPPSFYDDCIEKLKANGVDVLIRPFSYKYLSKKIVFIATFFITNIPKFVGGYNSIIGLKSLLWFLKLNLKYFEPPTSIHAQFATQATILALMLKMYFGGKVEYSFTFHAYDIYFKNKWFSILVNESKNTFSISQYNIDYVQKKYENLDIKRIKLIRLGVFRPSEIKKQKKDSFTIGVLSWFVPKKGINYLLETMKMLNEQKSEVKLIMAGDGPQKKEIINYIDKNELRKPIEYIGKIAGAEKEKFFCSMDAFVLPSITVPNDQDGIPVVLMEAISYGLPIISTDVSGIPEICINNCNGYLIPQKDVGSLVEAIIKLKNDKKIRVEFGKNSLKLSIQYDILNNSMAKLKGLHWIT